MAKGTLIFNLPEEKEEFLLASLATDWALVVFDMAQYLRSISDMDEEKVEIEEVKNRLQEYLESRNLSLDMIS